MTAELTGYADPLVVQPGQRLHFKVSTDLAAYEATIVRLVQADENPAGPGYKEAAVDASVNGRYTGRKQIAYPGSFIVVPDHSALRQLSSLTLQMWIYPTTPQNGEVQGLVAKWSAADNRGF